MSAPLPSLALAALLLPAVLAGQSRASKRIDAAFVQLTARNLDSAEVLLRPVLDSVIRATGPERGAAFMLLGVIDFFRGRDSATGGAFRASLGASLTMRGEWLTRLDSSLGEIWKRERSRAICGWAGQDSGGQAVMEESIVIVAQRPKVLRGPRVVYPERLRQAGVTGRVLLAALIDTMGRAEPGSIKVLDSPHDAFTRQARYYLERAVFQPGRAGERAVRVCIQIPIDFKITRD